MIAVVIVVVVVVVVVDVIAVVIKIRPTFVISGIRIEKWVWAVNNIES